MSNTWKPKIGEEWLYVDWGGVHRVDSFGDYPDDKILFADGRILPLDEPEKVFDKMLELWEESDVNI